MSNRNNNSKSNSNVTRASTNTRQSSSTSTNRRTEAIATSTSARAASSTRPSVSTPATTSTSTVTTTRRACKPMTIRVRTTGEDIERVPVQRSGYLVVRYEGRYHTVRGGGRTAPYIFGSEDGDDVLGRA